MKIQSHILDTIPVFKDTDTLEEVIRFFQHTTYSHVAVTSGGKFVGVLGEKDLDTFKPEKKIEDYRYTFENIFCPETANWIDVLELFSRNEANLLPVLNMDAEVLGYYDLNEVVSMVINIPFFTEPGAILVVAKDAKDYSFSEIAQIVESNNTKLLGAFITGARSEVVQITLKLGASSVNQVVQSFRRYNYSILYGSKDDQFLKDLKQRSDYLDKYLNV